MNTFNPSEYQQQLVPILKHLESLPSISTKDLARVVSKYPKGIGDVFSKDELIKAYSVFAGTEGLQPYTVAVVQMLKMKPMRTDSGVSPITVLTKPFPCPGKCIFCPSDIRMPKSYLADEPGAQRAERNWFDPYLQTYNRLQALVNIGHEVEKSEVIILGGTWSFYPEPYQIWFVKECFRALNDFGTVDGRPVVEAWYAKMASELAQKKVVRSNNPQENKDATQKDEIDGDVLTKTYNQVISQQYVAPEKLGGYDRYQQASWEELEAQQKKNETAAVRCVGLVVETRPDNISKAEVLRIRRLGCTKTQIGLQSLQDSVLEKNKRGHDVAASRRAIALLRQAGFKIHAHWMANLYGSNVTADIADYSTLFSDPDFMPDELKIYPCSLIGSAELLSYYRKGLWQPYSYDELLAVLKATIRVTPVYCRLTRIIRDIPSTDIVEGNKLTNFRQIAEQSLAKEGIFSRDIRAREIKRGTFDQKELRLEKVRYKTSVSEEIFLQYVVDRNKVTGVETKAHDDTCIVGFLRLSLPTVENYIAELKDAALIREVHVYGSMVGVGKSHTKKPQHLGLGKKLLAEAQKIAAAEGYKKIAVISSVGTREYYRDRGFKDGVLYQHKETKD